MFRTYHVVRLLLFSGILAQSMCPVRSRTIAAPRRVSDSPQDLQKERLHEIGQLLLDCLAQFHSSNESEAPVVLDRLYPDFSYSEEAMTSELRAIVQQMERQLVTCQELQAEY